MAKPSFVKNPVFFVAKTHAGCLKQLASLGWDPPPPAGRTIMGHPLCDLGQYDFLFVPFLIRSTSKKNPSKPYFLFLFLAICQKVLALHFFANISRAVFFHFNILCPVSFSSFIQTVSEPAVSKNQQKQELTTLVQLSGHGKFRRRCKRRVHSWILPRRRLISKTAKNSTQMHIKRLTQTVAFVKID